MLSKDCKNVQFCLVYSNKMVLTGIPSVLSLHAMKSEMAYVFIMPLKSCLFFFSSIHIYSQNFWETWLDFTMSFSSGSLMLLLCREGGRWKHFFLNGMWVFL